MSWEDDEFEVPAAAVAVVEKPKAVSLEAASYEKQRERALEKKAALEAEVDAAKAAVAKARAEAKETAASKAYVASLEKKVVIAAAAVVAAEKAILEVDHAESVRRASKKNEKKGVKQFDYERDYLGIERRGKEVILTV